MNKQTGMWIDHSRAFICKLTDKGETIQSIFSNVEKHRSRAGDLPLQGPFEALKVPESDSQQKSYTGYLNIYYDEVIDFLSDSEEIIIIGPGEAKGEFKKRLEIKNPDNRIVGFETVDNMTDNQIVAKIKTLFKNMQLQRQSK